MDYARLEWLVKNCQDKLQVYNDLYYSDKPEKPTQPSAFYSFMAVEDYNDEVSQYEVSLISREEKEKQLLADFERARKELIVAMPIKNSWFVFEDLGVAVALYYVNWSGCGYRVVIEPLSLVDLSKPKRDEGSK